MKKFLLFLSALLVSGTAYAAGGYGEVFNDSEAFVLAKAVKLGKATDEGDGGIIAVRARETKFKQCNRNADCHAMNMKYCLNNVCVQCKNDGDCKDNQKCTANSCVSACQGVSCASPRYQLTQDHLCVCAECEGHEQCGGGETGHKCDVDHYSCVVCSPSEKFCCANKGTGNYVPNGKGDCVCPLKDDGTRCVEGTYMNRDICDCQNCAAGDDSCGFCGANQTPDGEGGCKCVDISCPEGYHQDPNSCSCVENNEKGRGGEGEDDDLCPSICGSGFVYDRPGAKNGGKELVCTYYPLSCGYACTEGWDIRYLVNGTNYTCQRALQCGDTTVIGTKVGGGKKDMTNCPKETDDNTQCKSICGSGFYYDRPGAKNGGKERVCTYYPQSCGYTCTSAWDIRYLVGGTNYTCQRALQCGDNNVAGTKVTAGHTADMSACPAANDDDAQCKKLCGSGFYYDRPGAKNGGKERVCTRYPLSCGYSCTTGWDIDYLVQGTNYTCQTARQTAPDNNTMCKSLCGSGFYYDRPGAKTGANGKQEKVCTYYPLSCGYSCTTGWDIDYLVEGTEYTCQTARQTAPVEDNDDAKCKNLCGNSGYFYDRPGAKTGANGKQEKVCTYYPKKCGYACTSAWDIRYLVNGTEYTCQRAMQCGDKTVTGTKVTAGHSANNSGC